jgi:hypothetical protein
VSGDADITAESSGSAIRELADRLAEEAARAAEYRVRLELSEKAQSTLEEQLAEERRRREEAERERENMRGELEALREARESPEAVEEEADRAEPRSATGEAQDELGAERARREMAETTLHEGMSEERRRREEAERERDELRRELYARREPRESPEPADEQQGRGAEPRPATGGAQEAVRRPWWRRLFGG